MDTPLDFSEAVTYEDRVKVLVDCRHRPAAEVDQLLAKLQSGSNYDALCAVKVAAAARSPGSAATLLKLLGHKSPHIMKAAVRAAVRTVQDDQALASAFPHLSPTAQRRLLQAVRRWRGPDRQWREALARALLPQAEKAIGYAAAGALLKVAPPSDATGVSGAMAAHVKWHALASSRPDWVAKRIEAEVEAAEEAAKEKVLAAFKEAVWHALATAHDKEPAMRLLRSEFRFALPSCALSGMRSLVKHHAAEFAPLLVSTARRDGQLPVAFTRKHLLQKLPQPDLLAIARALRERPGKFRVEGLYKLLKALPPKDRATILEDLHAKGPLRIGTENDRELLLSTLNGELRIAEARRLIEEMSPEERRTLVTHLPWEEVQKELISRCRVPDERERTSNYAALVRCAWRSGQAAPALQMIVEKMRTEEGPVRFGAVHELRNVAAAGLLLDSHVPLLKQAMSHYVQAGKDAQESQAWAPLVASVLLRCLRSGAQDSPLASWAVWAIPQLRWGYGDDAEDLGWAGAWRTDFLDATPHMPGFGLLAYLMGISMCSWRRCTSLKCELLETLLPEQESVDRLTPERLEWTWKNVTTPLLQAAKVSMQSEGSSESDKYCYWTGLTQIALLLAQKPQKLLFTSPVLRPFLDMLLDELEPDMFTLVEPAGLDGDATPPAGAPLPGLSARLRIVEIAFLDAKSKERVLRLLSKEPKLLIELARGPSSLEDGRPVRDSTAVARLMALRPHLLLPAFLSTSAEECETPTCAHDEDRCDRWPGGLPQPPLFRVSYSRWTPEEQQAFFERWVLPLSKKTDWGEDYHDFMKTSGPRPLPPAERALRMMARLTFAEPVLPHLEAVFREHSKVVLALLKEEREATEKAMAAAAAGDAEEGAAELDDEGDEEEGEAREQKAKNLKCGQWLTASAGISMAMNLQGSAGALPILREGVTILPGQLGRMMVQSLRRASASELGCCSDDVVELVGKEDLPGIGVRKELMRSLGMARRLDMLCALYRDDAHRDVRIALLASAAPFAAQQPGPIVDLLTRAAAGAAKAEPIAENGALVAINVAELVKNINPLVLPAEAARRVVSDVLGPLLKLPTSSRAIPVREAVMRAWERWLDKTAMVRDLPKLRPLIAEAAASLALDEEADWDSRRQSLCVLARCAHGAMPEVLACVRRFQACLSSQETWAHGGRLLLLLLSGFQQVHDNASAAVAVRYLASLPWEPELAPIHWGFKTLGLPWGSQDALAEELTEVCAAVPKAEEEEFLSALQEMLATQKPGPEHLAALRAGAEALLRGDRLCRLAAVALIERLAGASPHGWSGAPRALLARLRDDNDSAVLLRARWLAVRSDLPDGLSLA